MATSTTNSDTTELTIPSAEAPTMDRSDGSDSKNAKKQVESPWGKIDAPSGTSGDGMMNFMAPMLDDMEKSVSASTKILDQMNANMEAERKQRFKKLVQSHIPEELKGGGKNEEDVMKLVDQLLFYEEVGDGSEVVLNEEAHLSELDECGKLTVTAHSLAAHFTTLEPAALGRASGKLWSDCRLWLSRLFRFKDSMPLYHDKRFEGLARVAQLALYTRYPKYATEGFEALYSRPPVFYISAVAPPGLGHYITQQLGLPQSCVSTVPCNTVFGASSKMDVAVLEKLISDDVSAAKTPVLLLAYAGSPIVGHVDNIERLQDVAKKNNVWLHVEGHNLATLTMFSVPTSVESAVSGDSLTLDLSSWLGVPSLPYITLFKDSDSTLTEAAGLTSVDSRVQLKCLPLWMCLQSLGHEGMVDRIKASCDLAANMYDHLDKLTTIKQISREKTKKDEAPKNVSDLIFKAINAFLVFEIVTPTVVFKYCEDTASPGAVVAPYAGMVVEDEGQGGKDAVYFDALNTWLAEALVMSNPRVPIDLVEVDKEGVCIRYAPLETAQIRGTTPEDIQQFTESLKSNLDVLNATTIQRKKFQTIVGANPNLRLVDLDNWAGLGAVSYIPDHESSEDSTITEAMKTEINNLNAELVHKLKAQDTAFSAGESNDEVICVRFGLITADTDVEELVSLVYSVGREVEESSKFYETMSDVIRKGIEEANKELQRESTDKLMKEGVLRQVPMVGSLLNWLSPSKEDIKGRTFNLKSGRILPTTDTYKYHMQIQDTQAAESSPSSSTKQSETTAKPESAAAEEAAESSTPAAAPATPQANGEVPTGVPDGEAVEVAAEAAAATEDAATATSTAPASADPDTPAAVPVVDSSTTTLPDVVANSENSETATT